MTLLVQFYQVNNLIVKNMAFLCQKIDQFSILDKKNCPLSDENLYV